MYRERFHVMGSYAVSEHSAFYSASAKAGNGGLRTSMSYWWNHVNLMLRFRVVDYVLAAMQYVRGEPNAKTQRVVAP